MNIVSEENTPTMLPARGALVVYVAGRRANGQRRFRIADVTGPVVADPESGRTWVGVALPDTPGVVDIVDCATIKNVVPPR